MNRRLDWDSSVEDSSQYTKKQTILAVASARPKRRVKSLLSVIESNADLPKYGTDTRKWGYEATLREEVSLLRRMIGELKVQHREALGFTKKHLSLDTDMNLTSLSWEQYYAGLSRPILTEPTCLGLAVEYFRLFRNGIKVFLTMSKSTETLSAINSSVQIDFLLAVMTPDVIYDSFVGVRALLQNWQRVTATHPDIDLHLVRLERSGEDSVVATVKGYTTFSESSVRYAFPHLMKGNSFSPLAQRLLGQQLEVDGVMQMIWDGNQSRVVNLQFQASMIPAMLRVLGSLEDVASVFNNARMDPECRALAQ